MIKGILNWWLRKSVWEPEVGGFRLQRTIQVYDIINARMDSLNEFDFYIYYEIIKNQAEYHSKRGEIFLKHLYYEYHSYALTLISLKKFSKPSS